MGQQKRGGATEKSARVGVLLGMLLVVWTRQCDASMFGDYWSRFDRFLATFDPAGRYVRQPIEKEIPALTFKGFYRQWSDILLTDNQRVGFRHKDFRDRKSVV